MKTMNQVSVSRKWMLFFLVLLSPEILAADNLNFNYKRAGTLSLEPRLGLQARACHSKGDPINIEFKFSELSPPPKIELRISGDNYTKGYSVFRTASGIVVADARTDPDFQVPWRVRTSGQVTGQVAQNSPAVQEKWNYPFCFDVNHPGNFNDLAMSAHTMGLFPVFRPDYFADGHTYWQITKPPGDSRTQEQFNWDEWSRWCSNKSVYHDPVVLWNGDPKDGIPQEIKHQIDIAPEVWTFLVPRVFFVSHTPGQAEGSGPDVWVALGQPRPGDSRDPDYIYHFPINNSNDKKPTVLTHGEFSFRLDNRNIKLLKLTLKSNGIESVWTWSRSADNTSWLHLSKTGNLPIEQVNNLNDSSDPYSVSNFYTRTQSYFKGTLVAKSFLKGGFTNHVPPLSLPPDSDGDINLVNTDSLTFRIGKAKNNSNWTVSVLGQPLKFAPIYINGKEAVSAMQVRDACY